MPLSDSKESIGAVTQVLQSRLQNATSAATVSVGRPETAADDNTQVRQLNLFLFQIEFDASLRNYALDTGQPVPLWVVLRYLLTAFDINNESDSVDAHRLLGEGMATLQDFNFIEADNALPSHAPLVPNPEPLKITFDIADAELLSKVLQGSNVNYRLSSAFQVRPIMLMPDTTPTFAPAVLSVGPPSAPGVMVLPTMGPRVRALEPDRFTAGQQIRLRGTDLTIVDDVCISTECIAAIPNGSDILANVPSNISLSPGSYPVIASKVLPSGRRFGSNAVLGHLLPNLLTAAVGPLTPTGTNFFGDITITGTHLGGPDDDIFVALYRDGDTAIMVEPTGTAAQTSLLIQISSANALPPGEYLLILRANGEQATQSPVVVWS